MSRSTATTSRLEAVPTGPWSATGSQPGGGELPALVVAATRLPVRRGPIGEWERNTGGLVTALSSASMQRQSTWVGWSGTADEAVLPFEHDGVRLVPVELRTGEYDDYFRGFANAVLWPLYHDIWPHSEPRRAWWAAYRTVNARFARRIAEVSPTGASIWVQDLHLQLVPALVRQRRPDVEIGFFLHTPFPPSRVFRRLPWREDVLHGVLGADLIGLQTETDAANLVSCLHQVLGLEATQQDGGWVVEWRGRRVRVGVFAVSIDSGRIGRMARDPVVRSQARRFRTESGDPSTLILGVDRLDSTKGIDAKLRAFELLLRTGRVDPERVTFVQVVTPPADSDRAHELVRDHIDELVGRINGDYASVGRPIVQYLHQTFAIEELVAMYLSADVMLVTPYGDGMNLVAKEYVGARVDGTGVLVLSEFAGAAAEFGDALICNPYDIQGLADVIGRAVALPADSAAARMSRLRAALAAHTVDDWAAEFLAELVPTATAFVGA